ncbi:hypothetical protein CDD83_628 [Cordyceps sp. RAO-2017]|nr:hypothetical protein CDD83_628 [Cordyceps sp. RAO-2017]
MDAYPPPLTEAERDGLVQAVKDWSMANGLAVRTPPAVLPAEADPAGITAIGAPVTLFPSPFPRVCFDQAVAVQRTYNELYAAVSRDEDFLADVVKQVGDGDDFIQNLWQIHLRVKQEGYTQPLSLGLFRSDYMVHQDGSTLQAKQVEFNTIAASFGGLSEHTSRLHKFLAATEYPLLERPIAAGTALLDLPENRPVRGLAAGLRAAHAAYAPSEELGLPTCVLFVVQAGERNVFDQRHLEYELATTTRLFRLALADVAAHTSVADTARRQLLYRHGPSGRHFEVAVVYLRAGYGPADYPDRRAWEARYRLERSAAIKCPSVLTQLAGAKKVQQLLAAAGALGRFLRDADDDGSSPAVAALRRTFTNIYPMDAASPAGREARARALDPDRCAAYVLKPQREGGGNNTYRAAIPAFLRSVPEEHWPSFILMELITPPPVSNLILRNGAVEQGGVICELGVYGTCLWHQRTGELLHNDEAGHLLRTKGDQSEEGGVAAGYGCMDSCALV